MSRAIVLALVALAVAAPLAGCSTSARGGGPGVSNFVLMPDKVGWNVTEAARFTLTLKPSFFASDPEYTIDRDLAIEEVYLHDHGWSFTGSHRTKNSGEVDLRLWRDGEDVSQATMDPTNDTLGVSVRLPQDLRDSEYSLELKLFKVGWVESDVFRVHVK